MLIVICPSGYCFNLRRGLRCAAPSVKHGFPTDFEGIPKDGSDGKGCCKLCLDELSRVDIIQGPVLRGIESMWQCLL